MKYMGSKRWMLKNGLGEILTTETAKALRFVDLFSGSAAVSHFVAERSVVPVVSNDLQRFSAILAESITGRTEALDCDSIWRAWSKRAERVAELIRVPRIDWLTRDTVLQLRSWSARQDSLPITKAYGGHYFHPAQSVWIDALRKTLPKDRSERKAALAALIQAASQCVAAPGHTAQPFQPTRTAKRFLREAWEKDVCIRVMNSLQVLCLRYAKRRGIAIVGDANVQARTLREGDLVFIDPPYSGVQYSRFYHVLETLAVGRELNVSGIGRYPSARIRPRSDFSVKSRSHSALESLLERIGEKRAKVIFTFPDHECSNGLSGDDIRRAARKHFRISSYKVTSRFSTLGGVAADEEVEGSRAARQAANELILLLNPK